MATAGESPLKRWYQRSIGKPATTDEVYGYWLFALGIVAGFLGIGLVVLSSGAGEPVRGAGIALAALALVALLVGQIIRLPLERTATVLSIGGAVISVVAVGWFVGAFNANNWGSAFLNSEPVIIGLYGVGVLVMAAGSVLTPLVTRPPKEQAAAEARAGEAEAERDAARAEVRRHEDQDRQQATAVTEARTEQMAAEARAGEAAAERDAATTEIERLEGSVAAAEASDDLPDSQSQFELYTDSAGEFRWRLRHDNGNIIADGSEGYSSRQSAVQGLDAVRRDAARATLVDLDERDDHPETEPDGDEEIDDESETGPKEPADSQSQFELYTDTAGAYRWRLRHDNGNIIADGSQGYASRESAMQGLDAVKRDAVEASVVDLDTEDGEQSDELDDSQSRFELYTDEGGDHRWRLRHDNGNIIADGSEGYSSRQKARQGLDAVKRDVVEATVLDLDEMDGDETADEVTTRDEDTQ
jgi:uncharacterized protein YegP (UPF0339 family)